MNPPPTPPPNSREATTSAGRSSSPDPAMAPLDHEDLLGDLDPGWLDWRERQARR